ncbi:MAG: nucleotidyltransferase family protein [Planctomycetales bacterium]
MTLASTSPDVSHITAAILAGGLGTRLRAAIGERQKAAADVADRPFVAWLLDQLSRAGIRKAVLCTGYQSEEVARRLGDEHAGMQVVHSAEPRPLDTAGGLAHALPHLESQWLLVLNGDSYCGVDLAAFAAAVFASGTAGGIVLVHQDETASYGRVEIDESHRIRRFIEKGADADPGWINAGVYLLRRELLAEIPGGRPASLEREMFPRWIVRGVVGYPCDSPFLDIGTPERYAEAQAFFKNLTPRRLSADGGS